MYLARRNIGGTLRVYRNCGAERIPRAWTFNSRNPETGLHTDAAVNAVAYGTSFEGCAATGETRGEAISNLHAAEEAAPHV